VGRVVAAGLGEPAAGGLRPGHVPVVVEVAVATTRHGAVRFVRLREDLR
jgi:hypothetical protein